MKPIIIDANIAISLLIPVPYSDRAVEKIKEWQLDKSSLLVPSLWHYELISGVRKAVAHQFLSLDEATAGLRQLLKMGFDEAPPSKARDEQALLWAGRLNQIVAYDAVYVALAEEMGAELWTADRRLAEAASRAGAKWVRLLE